MTRGVALTRWVTETFAAAEPVFALLTQLGDTWLLAAVAVGLYTLGAGAPLPGWDRRRGAAVLAVTLLAIATTGLIKAAVALPRPAGAGQPAYRIGFGLGDLYAAAATAHGFGFPSGHAVGATAVYGTVAGLVAPPIRRRAVLCAAGLVVLVIGSRLALGVHYLVDVVVGVGLGLLLGVLAVRWVHGPVVTFAMAVPAAAGWAVVSDGASAAVGTGGLCVGALLAWARVNDRFDAEHTPRGLSPLGAASASLLLGAVALAAIELGSRLLAAVAGVLGMAAIVTLPLVAR